MCSTEATSLAVLLIPYLQQSMDQSVGVYKYTALWLAPQPWKCGFCERNVEPVGKEKEKTYNAV